MSRMPAPATTRITAIGAACVLASALAVSACDDGSAIRITRTSESGNKGVLKVVRTLQCPQTQGSLTRKGTAQSEGTVCTYAGPRGSEVTLHLIALDGTSVDAVLKSFEDRLSTDMPQALVALDVPSDPASDGASSGTDQVSVTAPGVSVQAEGEKAAVRVPGVAIDADGETASVRIGPVSIQAADSGANVDIRADNDSENVRVRASDAGAVVRTRASGEATRASWILSGGQTSDSGWRMVGYEARGPSGGPLVIAVVRAKQTRQEPVFGDARDLLALNVGE